MSILLQASDLEASATACREYDRLEAEALKQRCKPKYSLAGEDHQTLVKSTVELACNPKLKGKIAFAIKEALANAAALQELTIGLVRFYYLDGLRNASHKSAKYLACVVRASETVHIAQHQQAD